VPASGPRARRRRGRAPDAGYGEVTGITQTVRNLGASLGLAVMGSLFTSPEAGPVAVADHTRTIAFVMAGIMLAAFVVAQVWLPKQRALDHSTEHVLDVA